MVTLFRRIREKLVQSGSLTKYLFYAIGEILLVVIGILIALQVNNWNEARKEAENRTEMARNLLDELKTAEVYNQEYIAFNREYRDRIVEFINGGCGQDLPAYRESLENSSTSWVIDVVSMSGYLFGFAPAYNPNTKNYKRAVNDGSIALIRNDISFNLEDIYVNTSDFNRQMITLIRERNDFLQNYIASTYGQTINETSSYSNNTWDEVTELNLLEQAACDGTVLLRLSQKTESVSSTALVTGQRMALIDSTIVMLEEFLGE